MILQAAQFAIMAHGGQKRKYTGRPYIEHPMRVAGRVMLLSGVYPEVVAAAWLHDVIEDCPQQDIHVLVKFNRQVNKLIRELTNPSKGLKLPRHERKLIDRNHLATVSHWAKIIKILDRTDNLREMREADTDFKSKYIEESVLLAEVLTIPGDSVAIGLRDEMLEATTLLRFTL